MSSDNSASPPMGRWMRQFVALNYFGLLVIPLALLSRVLDTDAALLIACTALFVACQSRFDRSEKP